jgi:acetoin:2,6-dichlorophenolindophenol oxidoreductase subunit alpha
MTNLEIDAIAALPPWSSPMMIHAAETDRAAVEAIESMLLIRTFESKSIELQAAQKAPATCTSVGQEASAVGVVRALRRDDQILTNHRSAGHLLARGADPGRLFAEIQGKATGYCKGKSGSLHISVRDLGVVLTSTIVGAELSLATGVGLAVSMSDNDAIVVCFFGDGAACEGIFHESLNLASVWNLPILYVCENNQFQAFVHRKETMLTDYVADWARPFGIEAKTVDGNDVEAVFERAKEAAAYVRTNRRPCFLETYTYRQQGHMSSDDQAYVDKDEHLGWLQKDPIKMLESRLLADKAITPAALEAIRARVSAKIEAAARFALESPFPDFKEMTTDVYA